MAPATSASASAAAPVRGPSVRLVVGLSAFVIVLAVAGYAWRGHPAAWNVGPQASAAARAAEMAASDPAQAAKQIEEMVNRLAERMASRPDDAEGWAMLGRSYTVLGRHADAMAAFKHVAELRPNDAQALADYADSMGMAQGQSLKGEPEQLIARALKADPKNVKALALAGTVSFDKGDYAGAVRYWETASDLGRQDADFVRSLQGAIDEARARGGMAANGAAGSSTAAPTAPATGGAAAVDAAVSGRVTLKADLGPRAGPLDTLFVFARAVGGPPMPLAVLRKQVRDLPLDFRLDDSMAMSPAMKISGAPQVVVSARISKSGNPLPQPGDLQGVSAPVKPGTSGVAIEIDDIVK